MSCYHLTRCNKQPQNSVSFIVAKSHQRVEFPHWIHFGLSSTGSRRTWRGNYYSRGILFLSTSRCQQMQAIPSKRWRLYPHLNAFTTQSLGLLCRYRRDSLPSYDAIFLQGVWQIVSEFGRIVRRLACMEIWSVIRLPLCGWKGVDLKHVCELFAGKLGVNSYGGKKVWSGGDY